MKAIILGDVHIGKATGIGKPGSGKELNSRVKDQLDLLDWVRKKALELDVNTIIITGDVYEDPRPHPALINYFMSWLKECERSSINVHVIAGNHDIIRTGSYVVSALDIVSSVDMLGARVYKEVSTINFDGLSITMVPYRDRRMYEVETTQEALRLLEGEFLPELKKIPEDNLKVLVGHLAIEGSISIGDEIDDELNEIFCPPSIFKDWDFTWMGHVHNPQVMHEYSKKEPYHVAHIGSMEKSDFSKYEMLNEKFIVAVDSDEKSFERIKLPNRSIHKVEITVPKGKHTTEYVINSLASFNKENSLERAIIKLDVKLASDVLNVDRKEVLDYIYNTLNSHYVCYFSESRQIEMVVVDNDSMIDNSITPEAAIDMYWGGVDDIDDSTKEKCKTLGKRVNKIFNESQKK